TGLYETPDDSDKPNFYFVTMFPYPSGDMHIGHWYAMAPSDCEARFIRMRGRNVLFPMGFDAFGINAENAAIDRGIHPAEWTERDAEALLRSVALAWPARVSVMQEHWIGRSEGAEIEFPVEGHRDAAVRFFTTRPDTIYGATFMVLAPEHPLVPVISAPGQKAAVD